MNCLFRVALFRSINRSPFEFMTIIMNYTSRSNEIFPLYKWVQIQKFIKMLFCTFAHPCWLYCSFWNSYIHIKISFAGYFSSENVYILSMIWFRILLNFKTQQFFVFAKKYQDPLVKMRKHDLLWIVTLWNLFPMSKGLPLIWILQWYVDV